MKQPRGPWLKSHIWALSTVGGTLGLSWQLLRQRQHETNFSLGGLYRGASKQHRVNPCKLLVQKYEVK